MNAWDVHTCDLGWGEHPVVVVSHPGRAARKNFVEVLDCSSQRASRPPLDHEILLDTSDGMDWPTFCKCDCIFAVPREEIKTRRGTVTHERRRAIVSRIIQSHAWNVI